MPAKSRAIVIASALLVAACGTDPVVPPTPLSAIKAETGFERSWKTSLGSVRRGRFAPYVNDGVVYVADSAGKVRSLDQKTGKTIWSKSLDITLGSGVSGDAGQIYVSSGDGEIYAMQASSGDVLWQSQASSEVLVPISAGFSAVVVRSADGRIANLDAATGKELWSVTHTPPALTINGYSQPHLLDGGALVGLDDGRLIALNLSSGKTIWETIVSLPSGRSEVERLVDIDSNILTDDQAIYVVNYRGKLARIEPAKGQIQWAIPMSSTAGIAQTDTLVVVVDELDLVHGVAKDDGRIVWSQEATKGRGLSQPVINNNVVMVGDKQGVLHGISLEDGRLIARNTTFDSSVGKSTLFNKLTRTQDALVADFPGLTRDRQYGEGKVGGWPYIVIDTGGLNGEAETLSAAMAGQTLAAIATR